MCSTHRAVLSLVILLRRHFAGEPPGGRESKSCLVLPQQIQTYIPLNILQNGELRTKHYRKQSKEICDAAYIL